MKNPQAFPINVIRQDNYGMRYDETDGGMTLLDYFAGQVLAKAIEIDDYRQKDFAHIAYNIAKTMLKERVKHET